MSNESETIKEKFEKEFGTKTDYFNHRGGLVNEVIAWIEKEVQEYSSLQNAELKQTILDFIHTNQNDCLDDGEIKAFERLYDFIENLNP